MVEHLADTTRAVSPLPPSGPKKLEFTIPNGSLIFNMNGRASITIHLVVSTLLFPSSVLLADEVQTAKGFTLEGNVIYHPDESRPWKLSRYYIKDRKTGLLAEAVVALTRSDLKKPMPAKTVRMDQVAFQFVPETIAIQAGDSVKFTNSDEAVHNVMTHDGGEPINANMAKNETLTHPFNQAGGIKNPVRINCIFHGGMRAWIYVFDHPWHNVTSKNGSFRLTNVAAGDYILSLSHPAGQLSWEKQVSVTGDTKLAIDVSPDNVSKPKP